MTRMKCCTAAVDRRWAWVMLAEHETCAQPSLCQHHKRCTSRVAPPSTTPKAACRSRVHCVGLNTAVRGAAHVHIPPGKLNWAPTVVRQTRPPEAVTAASPVAVLASLNDFAYNFGHALFDFLFPVFNMLQLLGLYHPNFQLLLGTHQVGPLHARSLLQAMMPASLDMCPPSRQGA